MADAAAVLPGALEPGAFFGRTREVQRLARDARSLSRGRGRSRALVARPGWGKSELLRQWHGRLFAEGEILPVHFAVPAAPRDAQALAGDFLAQVCLQALAFKRRDAGLLLRPPARRAVAEGLRTAWPAGAVVLAEAALLLAEGPPGDSPLAWAAGVPHRLAAATGTRALVLLDDAGNLLEGGRWPAAAASSPLAPLLLALDDEAALAGLFGSGGPALATLERLGPLGADAGRQLARHLSRSAGLEVVEAAVETLVAEAAGSPFYLGALVRELQEQPGCGPEDVARAAAAAVCDGELARYWTERLAGCLPERATRATAVEILAYCVREEGTADCARLPALMLKPEREIEAALAGLGRAGVVRLECARVAVDPDPVFRAAVAALYRREFAGAAAPAVTAACAADKVRAAPEASRRARRAEFRESLGRLFGAWEGQRVPAVLFDAPDFQRRLAALAEGEETAALAAEEAQLTLPRVISVASGRVGAGGTFGAFEADALAWGLRAAAGTPDADVAWVACRVPGGPGGAAQLAAFDRQVGALQAAGELPSVRLVRWALLERPLDADGEREAAGLRLATSLPRQLGLLASLLGVAAPPAATDAAVERPSLEMEMTIPRAADAELVAARALEQLAENLELGPEETGRLKTALVEACINAFEHSGEREARVRIWFAVEGERLLVRVENRGRPLATLPAAAAAGAAPQRRGWGLTLIRRLVDEVRLEPREDGVSLLMIKRLGGARRG